MIQGTKTLLVLAGLAGQNLVSGLTVTLNYYNPMFCFEVAKEREVQSGKPSGHVGVPIYDKTLEMHYDVSGPGADEVDLRVWRLFPDSRERIYAERAKPDGYYEADFVQDELLAFCFSSLDKEEKDLSIMLNQVVRNQVQFAQMNHVEVVTQRLKDYGDDLDVISHNLGARINYDADIV